MVWKGKTISNHTQSKLENNCKWIHNVTTRSRWWPWGYYDHHFKIILTTILRKNNLFKSFRNLENESLFFLKICNNGVSTKVMQQMDWVQNIARFTPEEVGWHTHQDFLSNNITTQKSEVWSTVIYCTLEIWVFPGFGEVYRRIRLSKYLNTVVAIKDWDKGRCPFQRHSEKWSL